ncbi:MAG: YqgE/AlgH family protein [Gammaproteobacteria bacterium]
MDLTNHFLISTGSLSGSVFADSVVLVCSHDSEGAFGLVINKPSPAKEGELLSTLKAAPPGGGSDNPVMRGGPVKPEQVVILHSPPREFDVTIKVDDNIGVTLSRDILTAVSEGAAPDKVVFYCGYAGWEGGKLESEVGDNAWITMPASLDIVFDLPPSRRLAEATRRLGFDINLLADMSGNA